MALSLFILACSSSDDQPGTITSVDWVNFDAQIDMDVKQLDFDLKASIMSLREPVVSKKGFILSNSEEFDQAEEFYLSAREPFEVIGQKELTSKLFARAFVETEDSIYYSDLQTWTSDYGPAELLLTLGDICLENEGIKAYFTIEMTENGGNVPYEIGLVVSDQPDPSSSDSVFAIDFSDPGYIPANQSKFNKSIVNLAEASEIYVKPYAKNLAGTAYGNELKVQLPSFEDNCYVTFHRMNVPSGTWDFYSSYKASGELKSVFWQNNCSSQPDNNCGGGDFSYRYDDMSLAYSFFYGEGRMQFNGGRISSVDKTESLGQQNFTYLDDTILVHQIENYDDYNDLFPLAGDSMVYVFNSEGNIQEKKVYLKNNSSYSLKSSSQYAYDQTKNYLQNNPTNFLWSNGYEHFIRFFNANNITKVTTDGNTLDYTNNYGTYSGEEAFFTGDEVFLLKGICH